MFRWKPRFAKVPKKDPFLLVGNHTSMLDPVWSAYWIGRRANFMASSALFRIPVVGKVLSWCGAFPKAKFVKDRDSMKLLAERYEAGEVVVLYPEGTRTWDGRPGEVLPGIGRLVKRLDANVVVARHINGHLFHPRWARYPRWLKVEVEHIPLEIDTTQPPEVITAQIAEAMRIDHTVEAPRGTLGWRLAHGLPAYLWACPACFELEALTIHPRNGNAVVCVTCEVHWEVDVSARLHGPETLRVDEAFDRIAEQIGSPPVACKTTLSERGVALAAQQGKLSHLVRGEPSKVVASGPVALGPEGLSIGERAFPLGELQAVSVEVANRLTFRDSEGSLFRLDVDGESPLKWAHFLRGWLQAVD